MNEDCSTVSSHKKQRSLNSTALLSLKRAHADSHPPGDLTLENGRAHLQVEHWYFGASQYSLQGNPMEPRMCCQACQQAAK